MRNFVITFLCSLLSFGTLYTDSNASPATPLLAQRYMQSVELLSPYPDLREKFVHVFSWATTGKKAPPSFNKEARVLNKKIAELCAPLVAEKVLSFITEAHRQLRNQLLKKIGAIGVGIAALGGAGYTLHKKMHKTRKTTDNDGVSDQHKRYGNKASNLMTLKKLCALWKNIEEQTGYRVAVPEFVSISSETIKSFLRDKIGYDIDTAWGAVQSAQDRENALSCADTIAKEVSQKLKLYIADHSTDGAEVETLLKSWLGEETCRLIESTKDRGERLMVRSTGKEDSTDLANAGGNESVPNVGCEAPLVLRAAQKVIVSYLEKKSLLQRLKAGDDITALPFIPLLIQRMIGEQPHTKQSIGSARLAQVPRSGVMFTEEPEGGSWRKTGKASNITIIQAAWGHNELVVNSLGAVDTILISDEITHKIIRKKALRMVPSRSGELLRIPNDKQMQTLEVLDDQAIRALKMIACRVEGHYGRPQDLEFTIASEEGEKIIYLLQSRPLVYKDPQKEPSYLNLANPEVSSAPQFSGITVGTGGGFVRAITASPDPATQHPQVIRARTLLDALHIYLALSVEAAQRVEAILVQEMPAATSHEATTFRGENKAVIYLGKKYPEIENWLTKDFVIDPQQSLLVEGSFAQSTDKVIQGWINYPLPRQLSIVDNANKVALKVTAQVDAKYASVSPKKEEKLTRSIIREVKLAESPETLHHLFKRIWAAVKLIEREILPPYQMRFNLLKCQIAQTFGHILTYPKIKQQDPDYLVKRLYPAHFLDILLFQTSTDTDCIKADSVINIFKNVGLEKESRQLFETEVQTDYADARPLLNILGTQAFRDDLKLKWTNFLKETFPKLTKDTQEELLRNIRLLNDLRMLPLWFNTSVAAQCKGKETLSVEDVAHLNAEVNSIQPLLEKLAHQKALAEQTDMSKFASPESFMAAWQHFSKEVIPYFSSEDFSKEFTGTSRLGKCAALEGMRIFVTTFDSAIKAVTGSREFKIVQKDAAFNAQETLHNRSQRAAYIKENKDKLIAFYVMLEAYATVLLEWYQWSTHAWRLNLPDHTRARESLETAIKNILTDLCTREHLQDEHMLKAVGFDPSLCAVGAGGKAPDSLTINTLEKAFIFTHQSLINIIGCGMQLYCFDRHNLPQKLLAFLDLFEEKCAAFYARCVFNVATYSGPYKAKLIGMSCDEGVISIRYSLPYDGHSALASSRYSIKGKTMATEFDIFGHNLGMRFNDFSWLLKKNFFYLLPRPKLTCITEGERLGSLTIECPYSGDFCEQEKRIRLIDSILGSLQMLKFGIELNQFWEEEKINSPRPAENSKDFLLEEARSGRFLPMGTATILETSRDTAFRKELGELYLKYLDTSIKTTSNDNVRRAEERRKQRVIMVLNSLPKA